MKMKADKVVATLPTRSASNCLHRRVLENICDSHSSKADTLRCCECGAFVVVHTQHSELS